MHFLEVKEGGIVAWVNITLQGWEYLILVIFFKYFFTDQKNAK